MMPGAQNRTFADDDSAGLLVVIDQVRTAPERRDQFRGGVRRDLRSREGDVNLRRITTLRG